MDNRDRYTVWPRAAVATGLVAAAIFAAPQAAMSQTKISVGMPTSPPNIVHIPIYVAKDLGYFKKEGLDVEILAFEGGVKSFRAAVSRDVDVGVGSGPFSIVGRARGAPTKIFLANAPKLEVTMVGQGNIKDLKDLKGKRIGIQQPGGFAWVLSMMVLRSAKIKKDDVNFVSILSEDVPPLVAGQIDTAILHVEQEMVAKSKKPDLKVLARLWEIAPKQLYNVFAAREDVIKKKRKAFVALAKGHIWATRQMYTNPKAVTPIIMKHTGLDKETVEKAYKILVDSCIWDANHGLSRERVNFTTKRMEKVGNIEKGKAPKFEESIDLSIANEALKELGLWKGPICPATS